MTQQKGYIMYIMCSEFVIMKNFGCKNDVFSL